MDSAQEYWDARSNLQWQVELGADEAIGDAPIDRYALVAKPTKAPKAEAPEATPDAAKTQLSKPKRPPTPEIPTAPKIDSVGEARAAANAAPDLTSLRGAMQAFDHCALKSGAQNLVFADGHANARVMVIADAPDRDDDKAGRPFAGPQGALFDKMFAAIGLDRASEARENALYLSYVLPWRPLQNRDPSRDEIAMMMPFVERHIALVAPDYIVLMGNLACQALLGKSGTTRLRGQWTQFAGLPTLPMFAPSYLMQNLAAKREAWGDLLDLKSKLKQP